MELDIFYATHSDHDEGGFGMAVKVKVFLKVLLLLLLLIKSSILTFLTALWHMNLSMSGPALQVAHFCCFLKES